MTIFLGLNGLGVIFLMYVLVNFLREGRRPRKMPGGMPLSMGIWAGPRCTSLRAQFPKARSAACR